MPIISKRRPSGTFCHGKITHERSLLEIKNLVTGFETESGLLKAVDGVGFTVPKVPA